MRIILKRGFFLICSTIILIIILYLSATPGYIAYPVANLDKVKHFIAYFILGTSIYLTIKSKPLTILITGVYSLIIETLQIAIPGRCFSILDLSVNYLGTFAILLITNLLKKQ